MNPILLSASLVVSIASAGCELDAGDPQAELSRDDANAAVLPVFHEGVGAPVDAATATRWIDHRRAAGAGDGSYTVQAAVLRRTLELPGCVGISLQYGVDDAGAVRLFPVGVDGSGRTIDDPSSPADTRRFIGRYTESVRSHFFGRDTFARLLDERHIEVVRATPALDDENAPQLLLSDAAEKEPRIYEDESRPCPPACPT